MMGRPIRRLEDGGLCHVYNRAALGQNLFERPGDWPVFLGTLRDALDRRPVRLMAWCLMPNHWHLLLQPIDAPALPSFMRWLTLAHSHRWQAMRKRPGQGTLYQGRYGCRTVASDEQLLIVVRYIERACASRRTGDRLAMVEPARARDRPRRPPRPAAAAVAGRLARARRHAGDPGGAGGGTAAGAAVW